MVYEQKYGNDSLINEHKSANITRMTIYTILQVLAPFNLHVIKGEKTAGLLSNDLSRIVDVRGPDDSQTGVQRTKLFRRRHNASCDCCRFRTSLQEDLQDRTTSPTLSCSRFIADSLTTTLSFYRRDSAPPGQLTHFSTSPLQQTPLSSPL